MLFLTPRPLSFAALAVSFLASVATASASESRMGRVLFTCAGIGTNLRVEVAADRDGGSPNDIIVKASDGTNVRFFNGQVARSRRNNGFQCIKNNSGSEYHSLRNILPLVGSDRHGDYLNVLGVGRIDLQCDQRAIVREFGPNASLSDCIGG